ncbi:outer membrane protein assembly factor BamD [Candidatus Pelagibacter sp. HIMB1695]|uniref:outer membrane protein assembly factor BamD n=1 Tax=Candidatus Pelagibacter sp. HIMB1695 TaxID=3413364 RepID=UPI003F83FBA6
MNFKKLLFLIISAMIISSCSKDPITNSVISEKNLDLQLLEAYKEGVLSLEAGDVLYAAKKFNEAETLYPQSEWAPKSSLMAAYSYYSQDYYLDSIAELTRFKKVYPKHKDLDYANYLLGICYYEQIVDEKKDLNSIKKAKDQFISLINNYPNSEYATDAEYKIDYINEILASKEMYIGRYYFNKKKWIPAINRFRNVIDDYYTSVYVEEALYRLVEIYYTLGLEQEAQKYAFTLGYNYKSSKWYEKSYEIFNKSYKIKKFNKNKKENSILNKVKSLIN